jgi:F0F1-type ATP synthase membrane subunit b/b'
MNFWEYFVHSNAFNFTIMVLILAWIIRKAGLATLLESVKTGVAGTIDKSKKEKNAARKELRTAQKSVENVAFEVKSLLKQAKAQAQTLAAKILEATGDKVKQIEAGVKKAVDAEEKAISSRLTNIAAQQSVELAKADILARLKKNPKLHEQFINESIESL